MHQAFLSYRVSIWNTWYKDEAQSAPTDGRKNSGRRELHE